MSEEEIVVCPKCHGKGYIIYEKLICHHTGTYKYKNVLCHDCNGKGLVNKKITVDVEYTPIKDKDIEIENLSFKEIQDWEKTI